MTIKELIVLTICIIMILAGYLYEINKPVLESDGKMVLTGIGIACFAYVIGKLCFRAGEGGGKK